MSPELQAKVEFEFEWSVLGNLNAATKGVDRSLFREADQNRLRRRFGRMLVLDKSSRDSLQHCIVLRRVSPQQFAELLRSKVQCILLQDWIDCSGGPKLFVVGECRVARFVIEIETLTTGVQSYDGLLCLQVFKLHTGVFI